MIASVSLAVHHGFLTAIVLQRSLPVFATGLIARARSLRRAPVVPTGTPGFLLLTPELEPLYSNQAALEVLGYPDGPVRNLLSLQARIRGILDADRMAPYDHPIEFLSGRRRYAGR